MKKINFSEDAVIRWVCVIGLFFVTPFLASMHEVFRDLHFVTESPFAESWYMTYSIIFWIGSILTAFASVAIFGLTFTPDEENSDK